MAINTNKSDQKKRARSQIYQKTIHREHQKLREKLKSGKTIESLTNPLLLRDYREIKKKTSQSLFTIALSFYHTHPNYGVSSFIEKTRVTSCDIFKLSLTHGLSFLYCEAFRLDRICCASRCFGDVSLLSRSECSSRDSE